MMREGGYIFPYYNYHSGACPFQDAAGRCDSNSAVLTARLAVDTAHARDYAVNAGRSAFAASLKKEQEGFRVPTIKMAMSITIFYEILFYGKRGSWRLLKWDM